LLGPPELLDLFLRSDQGQIWETLWPGCLLTALFGGVGIISLFLFFFSRSQREYLRAGISLTGNAALIAFDAIPPATNIPVRLGEAAISITGWIGYFALPLAAMYLLGVVRPFWRRTNYVVIAAMLLRNLEWLCLRFGLPPPTFALGNANRICFFTTLFAEAALLLAIAVDGLRTVGRKAWLPLTPGLLCACGLLAAVIDPVPIGAAGGAVGIYYYFYVSVPLAVLVIFLMRFAEQQRENARLVDDMHQAQEVQQVMLTEAHTRFPGFEIESEYRPAREVGGDFFQIVPHQSDGSLLIVAGDVTGKGLKAGMLVALLVGAIRTAARFNPDPLAVLRELNQRLLGRSDAQATCLALRIGADGSATLASAGHLPPYLNGEPLAMDGAFPLGVVEAAEFSLMHFQLNNGDKLVLISDGIAEATDANGNLYGFERVRQLLRTATTATGIAAEAQRFGQEDDISVIAVTCTGVLEPATD
jgi:sulfur transfer complex TusBCD TusB component (DsrH family)